MTDFEKNMLFAFISLDIAMTALVLCFVVNYLTWLWVLNVALFGFYAAFNGWQALKSL